MTDNRYETETETPAIEDGTKHHYFASFRLGWATANTRDEAVRKLMLNSMFRRDVKQMTLAAQKRGEPGCYCWSCKVPLPAKAKYSISFYAPQGVGATDGQHHYVTYITAKDVQWFTTEEAL